jgi:glucose/arabinose dehydrogenase
MSKLAPAAAALLLLVVPLANAQIALVPFSTGLSDVVAITHAGDGTGSLYFTLQAGIIRVHDGTQLRTTPFLNIDPLVQGGGEEGLLSTAFHPNYASNGLFYVYYTNNQGNNVVARYQRSAGDPFVANPASAFILLTISHPTNSNHNGGSMNFGPDGYLYIDTGDGGGGGDPDDNGQNRNTLLGKQLRLDVNNGTPYGIPPTNPFVGVPNTRAEVWAYGLRNPWRFTFDRLTGDMFIGDVGQGLWEEVDFQPANSPGGLNYGWDDMEGAHCFEPATGCLTAGRVLPILEHNHSIGVCAIVGGYRYRGIGVPAIAARYLYSDNCDGVIRGGTETSPGVWTSAMVLDTTHAITTFGEDQNGELYVSAVENGTVYRLVSNGTATISIGDVSVTEGDAGTVAATFTVSLSAAIVGSVTVQYATAAGTAVAGTDYTTVSGTLTFPPGTLTRTVTVPVLADLLDEDNETFVVNLSNATGATIADAQGQGTIVDNDPAPALSAGDCSVVEGNAGTTPCSFGVSLSPVSGRTVTVAYSTQGGSATSGVDFTAASGTLTFPAGTTSMPLNVMVQGDVAVETDEAFALTLSSPTNATLADAQGDGTILDDDAPSLTSLELTHGALVVADVAGGTPDFYRMAQAPRASYEVVLDQVSGDAVPGLALQRLAADNTTVLQAAVATGTGSAASLRWQNPLSTAVVSQHLRVGSAACGTGCGTDDTYRLRFYETTLASARFNNGGGQTSVITLQNSTAQAVNGVMYFWSPVGALLHAASFSLTAHGSLTFNSATIGALVGQSGSLTVSHDAGYGGLVGKSVALEPASGFSFDTPLASRPH